MKDVNMKKVQLLIDHMNQYVDFLDDICENCDDVIDKINDRSEHSDADGRLIDILQARAENADSAKAHMQLAVEYLEKFMSIE